MKKLIVILFFFIIIPAALAQDNCTKVPDAGICRGSFVKYYFDNSSNTCKSFVWGGCGGTVPFDDLYSCKTECYASRDTISTLPASPTSNDSISIYLFSLSHCCGTQYYNKSITVSNDTAIYLFYEADNSPCELTYCVMAGNTVSFELAALKAGTYSVYKAESPYCKPGDLCLQWAIAPEKIGEIVVEDPTSINNFKIENNSPLISARPNPFNPRTIISLGHEARGAKIEILNPKGKLIADFGQIYQTIQWNASDQASGLYLIKATFNNRILYKKLLLQK